MSHIKVILSRLIYFKEVIGVIIFYAAFVSSPFTPDLVVQWSIEPFFINTPKQGSIRRVDQKTDVDIITITISNKSNKTVSVHDFRFNGLESISQIGARSSAAYLNDGARSLIESKQVESSTYAFPGIKEIPAGHNIQIQIVGSMYRLLLFKKRIVVLSTAENTSVEQKSKASGFALFIDNNLSTIGSIITVILILLGAKRIVKGREA